MLTVIEGATALLRKSKGVFVIANLYRRNSTGQTFVKAAGGFVRIIAQPWDNAWPTGHPDIKVIEFDGFDAKDLV